LMLDNVRPFHVEETKVTTSTRTRSLFSLIMYKPTTVSEQNDWATTTHHSILTRERIKLRAIIRKKKLSIRMNELTIRKTPLKFNLIARIEKAMVLVIDVKKTSNIRILIRGSTPIIELKVIGSFSHASIWKRHSKTITIGTSNETRIHIPIARPRRSFRFKEKLLVSIISRNIILRVQKPNINLDFQISHVTHYELMIDGLDVGGEGSRDGGGTGIEISTEVVVEPDGFEGWEGSPGTSTLFVVRENGCMTKGGPPEGIDWVDDCAIF